MDNIMSELTSHVEERLKSILSDEKRAASRDQLWIALAGAPGSGKSTLSKEVASSLMSRGISTTVVPMDGFHYYRSELDKMPNAVEAHAKRGSHWTFNATRLVQVNVECT
jgi:pantothenate kinase